MSRQDSSDMGSLALAIESNRLPASIDTRAGIGKTLIDFITAYLRAWNARDARTIWADIYMLDPGHRLQSEQDLRDMLNGAVAAGWDHSRFAGTTVHPLPDGRFVIRTGYTRYTADDETLAPADRLGAYLVKPLGDGFRITGLPLAGRPLVSASPIAVEG